MRSTLCWSKNRPLNHLVRQRCDDVLKKHSGLSDPRAGFRSGFLSEGTSERPTNSPQTHVRTATTETKCIDQTSMCFDGRHCWRSTSVRPQLHTLRGLIRFAHFGDETPWGMWCLILAFHFYVASAPTTGIQLSWNCHYNCEQQSVSLFLSHIHTHTHPLTLKKNKKKISCQSLWTWVHICRKTTNVIWYTGWLNFISVEVCVHDRGEGDTHSSKYLTPIVKLVFWL